MIHYSRNCSEISRYSFDKISRTSNLMFIVRDYDEYEDVKFDLELANTYWQGIFNEYVELNDDIKTFIYYSLLSELSYLKTRKNIVGKLLNQMVIQNMNQEMFDKYIESLAKWKFFFNRKIKQNIAIEKLLTQLRGTDNKINLKESELKLYKDNSTPMTLAEEVVKLERALDKNLIDPKTTMMDKWVALLKEIKSKRA